MKDSLEITAASSAARVRNDDNSSLAVHCDDSEKLSTASTEPKPEELTSNGVVEGKEDEEEKDDDDLGVLSLGAEDDISNSEKKSAVVCKLEDEDSSLKNELDAGTKEIEESLSAAVAAESLLEAEEDEDEAYQTNASRTLHIENLDSDITQQLIREYFAKFGEILNIELSQGNKSSSTSYAYIQYMDIASVQKALRAMNGETIGNSKISLSFGRTLPSKLVMVYEVSSKVSEDQLQTRFSEYGTVTNITVDRNKGQALVTFQDIEAATEAVNKMRGVSLEGRRIRVDFASIKCSDVFHEQLKTLSTSSRDSARSGSKEDKKKPDATNSRNLWISGLSSSTRATDMKQVFSKYGKVIGAKVVTNAKTPGARCYGYITMSSSEDASKCIQHLHRTELHGRMISVERAKGEPGSTLKKAAAASHSKDKAKDEKVEVKKDESKTKEGEKTDEKAKSESKPKTEEPSKTEGEDRDKHHKPHSRSRSPHRRHRRPNSPHRSGVLTFNQIREERERQRHRMRLRELREEERRRKEDVVRQREVERRQKLESYRLEKERAKLRAERKAIEEEKLELLRLERSKLDRERMELKRQQQKMEEERRNMKRTILERDDSFVDRKRERRYSPPPAPSIANRYGVTTHRSDDSRRYGRSEHAKSDYSRSEDTRRDTRRDDDRKVADRSSKEESRYYTRVDTSSYKTAKRDPSRETTRVDHRSAYADNRGSNRYSSDYRTSGTTGSSSSYSATNNTTSRTTWGQASDRNWNAPVSSHAQRWTSHSGSSYQGSSSSTQRGPAMMGQSSSGMSHVQGSGFQSQLSSSVIQSSHSQMGTGTDRFSGYKQMSVRRY